MCSFWNYFMFLTVFEIRLSLFLYQLLPCQNIQSIYIQNIKARAEKAQISWDKIPWDLEFICVSVRGIFCNRLTTHKKRFSRRAHFLKKKWFASSPSVAPPVRPPAQQMRISRFFPACFCVVFLRIVERALALSLLQHLYDSTNLQLKSTAACKSSLSSSFVHRTGKRTRKIYAPTPCSGFRATGARATSLKVQSQPLDTDYLYSPFR